MNYKYSPDRVFCRDCVYFADRGKLNTPEGVFDMKVCTHENAEKDKYQYHKAFGINKLFNYKCPWFKVISKQRRYYESDFQEYDKRSTRTV